MTVPRGSLQEPFRTIEDALKQSAPDVLRALREMSMWGTNLRKVLAVPGGAKEVIG